MSNYTKEFSMFLEALAEREGSSEELSLRDILVDCMHYSLEHGINFDSIVEAAIEIFEEELTEAEEVELASHASPIMSSKNKAN